MYWCIVGPLLCALGFVLIRWSIANAKIREEYHRLLREQAAARRAKGRRAP